MPRVPDRGDVYLIDLEPTKGKEQRGKRPVFVLSPALSNRRGVVIVLPISQRASLPRSEGFASTLMGTGSRTQGVVICDQPRTLDFAARGARFVEALPDQAVIDALQRLAPLVT